VLVFQLYLFKLHQYAEVIAIVRFFQEPILHYDCVPPILLLQLQVQVCLNDLLDCIRHIEFLLQRVQASLKYFVSHH